MSMMVSFVLSFFPRDVLDEILNLIESVSEDFPSYFFIKNTDTQNLHILLSVGQLLRKALTYLYINYFNPLKSVYCIFNYYILSHISNIRKAYQKVGNLIAKFLYAALITSRN